MILVDLLVAVLNYLNSTMMNIDLTLLKCGNSYLPVCNMVFDGDNVRSPRSLFEYKLFFKRELFRLQLADNGEHRLARYAIAAYIFKTPCRLGV